MRLIHKLGAVMAYHPAHGEFHVGSDGVFTVPENVGHDLLANRAHWSTEDEHVAGQAQAALAELADPNKTPHVLLELRADRDRLAARVHVIEEHLGIQHGETSNPAAPGQAAPVQVQQTAEPVTTPNGPPVNVQGGVEIQAPAADGAQSTPDAAAPELTRQQKAAATRAANKAAAAAAADGAPDASAT